MSNDMNVCHFIGRLGAEVETRYLPNGDPVATMRLAVGKEWKDKQSGQKQEHTNWLTVVAFKRTAEICQQYLTKGSQVQFTCEVRVRKWQTDQGDNRYATEFVIQRMQMLGSPSGQQQPPQRQPPQQGGYQQPPPQQQGREQPSPYAQNPQNPPGPYDEFDDEIPFD